jgi:pyrroloquinoline quinone biosynthesis protein B
MKTKFIFLLVIAIFSCKPEIEIENKGTETKVQISEPSVIVLGNIQDAGSPHISCQKACCKDLFNSKSNNRQVVSLVIIDPENEKTFLIEATPDMTYQLKKLKNMAPFSASETSDGVFITHAHIGHYTGLMYFGKEAMNANDIPVYVMPKMHAFLENNGPWSQLVNNNNIDLKPIYDGDTLHISSNVSICAFKVPHRDEYSETVGFRIIGKAKSVLFIPDIDKWKKWESDIIAEIEKVDIAYLDGTFYDAEEINHRDISEIPHPFIIESMALFENLTSNEKKKIHFIHFNHTNPVINPDSPASKEVLKQGYGLARKNDIIEI